MTMQQFSKLKGRLGTTDYNYDHFRFDQLRYEANQLLKKSGIPPGARVPDFELPSVDGDPFRLSKMHDKPVLLRFVSYT